jgi:hypothetical protein
MPPTIAGTMQAPPPPQRPAHEICVVSTVEIDQSLADGWSFEATATRSSDVK